MILENHNVVKQRVNKSSENKQSCPHTKVDEDNEMHPLCKDQDSCNTFQVTR